MPGRRRRVALLGAGLAAYPHLLALSELGHEVVGVATRSAERLSAVRRVFPAASICWPPSAVVELPVDLALVLTPAATHLEMVRLTAAHGIDTVVEKPLEASVNAGSELVNVAGQGGIGLGLCFQYRASEGAQTIRELMARDAMGPLLGGSVTVPWWRDESYYAEAGRGTYERDGGGAVITQAIHLLDLLVWLVGEPVRIAASAPRSAVHDIASEELLSGVLEYPGRAAVSVFVSVASPPGYDASMHLVFGGASVWWRHEGLEVAFTDGRIPIHVPHDGIGKMGGALVTSPAWHQRLLAQTLDAFETGKTPLADGLSALATQRVVAGLYEASATGEWQAMRS